MISFNREELETLKELVDDKLETTWDDKVPLLSSISHALAQECNNHRVPPIHEYDLTGYLPGEEFPKDLQS